MEFYFTPDGSPCNQQIYVQTWRGLNRRLSEAYGLDVIGFDPGVLVRKAGPGHTGATVDLPMWLVKRMVEVADGGKECRI